MCAFRFLREILRRRDGNVAVLATLAMPLVVGGAAFGVDSLYWYVRDLELQAAADAGAYAAAIEMRAGHTEAAMVAASGREAGENGFDPARGTLTLNAPPATGGYRRPQAVEVVLVEEQDRFFSGLFDDSTVRAEARSVALYETTSDACVIALDPGAASAVSMRGSAGLTLRGCSVMANSISNTALNLGGSSRLETPCVISGGGVSVSSSLVLTECAQPLTRAPPVADPYRFVPEPMPSGSCLNGNAAVLQPGRYCNGLNLRDTVHLDPGVYYLEGGDFRANTRAIVTGSGVTIFLGDGVGTQFNGTATINLSAPTEGPYAGLLFFGDREGERQSHVFNGGAGSSLTGALYLPAHDVEYAGNFTGADGCLQVVARTVSWTGKATIAADCSARGMVTLPGQQLIRIVE